MYRAVIFDLDGTLLDTLDDLAAAVHHALITFDLPPRTKAEVRSFVGDGVVKLIERSVPSGYPANRRSEVFDVFKPYYAAHSQDDTHPYDGILSLLTKLREAGIRTAIVSNKFDEAVKRLSSHYFGELIEVAVGERESEGIRKKPAPDTLLMAIEQLGVSSCDTLYVGDADTDILTARAAGVRCISVTWGFRDPSFLLAHGAETLIHHPMELLSILKPKGSSHEST